MCASSFWIERQHDRMPEEIGARRRARKRPRTRLAVGVAASLRELLATGQLSPGDRLPTENQLARAHGVSRAVVREAIAALRSDGLVTARQGSGAFVAEPSEKSERLSLLNFEPDRISSVIEVLEIRAALECEAAAIAAERSTPAEFAKIREAQDAFVEAVAAGEQAEAQDFALHLAIAQSTHNRHFVEFFRFLGGRTIPRAQVSGQPDASGRMSAYLERIRDEHDEIVEAIAARDPLRARSAMRAHLKGSQERYQRLAEHGALRGQAKFV
jgi:GntR family transcriptional repressor for pyruvate dehydrogenase complex